jgi:alpha-tubulin suppressor-like RCC1 family protein
LWGPGDDEEMNALDGTTSDSALPVQVYGLSPVVEILAGVTHGCARTSDGALWCWGEHGAGQLGDGMSGRRAMVTTPVRVATLGTSVVEVCAGMGATCARGEASDVWCWGARSFGMMGDGDLGFALSPVGPAGCP